MPTLDKKTSLGICFLVHNCYIKKLYIKKVNVMSFKCSIWILVLVLLNTCVSFTYASTIRLSTPNPPYADKYEDINTVTLDARLPGNHLTNTVNSVADDINALRADLADQFRNMILTEPEVERLNYLTVYSNPLVVKLTRTKALKEKISIEISGLSTKFSVKAKTGLPLICTTATVTGEIKNITLTGEYNAYTGALSGALATDYQTNVSSSCGGIFGLVADLFKSVIVPNIAKSKIESIINTYTHSQEITQLFGLKDVVDMLKQITPANTFSQTNIQLLNDIIEAKNLNTDIQVTAKFYSGGYSNHLFVLKVGHPTPVLKGITGNLTAGVFMIDVSENDNAGSYDVYTKSYSGTSEQWSYLTTVSSGWHTVQFSWRANASGKYMFVANSGSILGLKSDASNTVGFVHNACRHCFPY